MSQGLQHGEALPLAPVQADDVQLLLSAGLPPGVFTHLKAFGYLFPDLAADPCRRLPDGQDTRDALIALGASLGEAGDRESNIPVAYSFLAQFIDHDMTLEAVSEKIRGIKGVTAPMPAAEVHKHIKNARTGTLDLDSLYTHAPRTSDSNLMLVGQVTPTDLRPIGKGDDNDVPRDTMPASMGLRPGQARIGDSRNDQTVIISQLHLAFLKFHNARASAQRLSFDEARTDVRRHYQWIVLHDFLPRICDPATLQDVMTRGPRWFTAHALFMPLEFSVCAYRFGHSTIRDITNVNSVFPTATLANLFQFVESTGGVGTVSPTLRADWIVEWDGLIDRSRVGQRTSAIDTTLASGLLAIPVPHDPPPFNNLAVRNLLRGFLLSMPTGQAVADELGVQPLTPRELVGNARTPHEAAALARGGFDEMTPLWYYILAEAAIRGGGNGLGPVGSRIVAETFVRFIDESADSIRRSGWTPESGSFTLADLLTTAGV